MGVSFPLIQNEAGQFVVDDLKAGIYFLKSNGGFFRKLIINEQLISINNIFFKGYFYCHL